MVFTSSIEESGRATLRAAEGVAIGADVDAEGTAETTGGAETETTGGGGATMTVEATGAGDDFAA